MCKRKKKKRKKVEKRDSMEAPFEQASACRSKAMKSNGSQVFLDSFFVTGVDPKAIMSLKVREMRNKLLSMVLKTDMV